MSPPFLPDPHGPFGKIQRPCPVRFEHARGGRPVPFLNKLKRMALRKGRLSRLVAHQAPKFPTIGQPPLGETKGRLPIHSCDKVQRLLPRHGKFGKVRVLCPGEPRQAIQRRLGLLLKSRRRPGSAFPEFSILSASGTGNLATERVVTCDLACLQMTGPAHLTDQSMLRSPPRCLFSLLGFMGTP